MAVTCKMSGGPMHGKYWEDQSGSDRIEIQGIDNERMPKPWDVGLNPYESLPIRRGHYARSNNILKNGVVIYKWMGWVQ